MQTVEEKRASIQGRSKPWESANTLSFAERRRNSYRATKRWRENNPERHKATNAAHSRKWREEHPESVHKTYLTWYAKNREEVLLKKREYYRKNKERFKEQARINYQKTQISRTAPRCLQCESILKEQNTTYCTWCVKTYSLTIN